MLPWLSGGLWRGCAMKRFRRRPLFLASLVLLAGCATSPTAVATRIATLSPAAPPTTAAPTATNTTVRPAPATPAVPAAAGASPGVGCRPTPNEGNVDIGPEPPERGSVGTGYIISGAVRSAETCRPIPGARVVLWLVNPQGVYDDASRGTVVAGPDGSYRFESHLPVSYHAGTPPHTHMRVTAPGYWPLVTTLNYTNGQFAPTFDLVLMPRQ